MIQPLAMPARTMNTAAYEADLLDDPSHDYARMDAASKDLYRAAVEEVASRLRCDPRVVAATAIGLAKTQCATTGPGDATRHVGYFLVAEGREKLIAALTDASAVRIAQPRAAQAAGWFGAATLAVGLLVGAAALPFFHLDEFGPVAAIVIATLLLAHAVGRTAMLSNLAARAARPRRLPRLDFREGMPSDCVTAVCVPTMLTDRQHVADMAANIERHWLTIADDNVRIVLLTDWPDADREEPTPEEQALLDDLAARVERLNASYGEERRTPFYLLHRQRRYSATERRWLGWERKRGKLLQFNRAIAEGGAEFARTVGDLADLRRATYAVVADDNTVLTPRTIQMLVGTIAHPVARLQRIAGRDGAMRGYGAIVPDIRSAPKGDGQESVQPRPVPGDDKEWRPPEWSRKTDFDLLGECKFPGQGLYDIRWAHRQLAQRLPEDCVLSHDVVEGGFLRCAFSERALFFERTPQSYRLLNERTHRWTRGDWQNLWVMFRLHRERREDGSPPLVAWYWVVQNLALSWPRLTFALLVMVLLWGDTAFADRRFAALLMVDMLPDFVAAGMHLWRLPRHRQPASLMGAIGRAILGVPFTVFVRTASSFESAFVRADAIVSTIVRILCRRHLLEWVPSGQLERGGMRLRRLDIYTYLVPAVAAVSAAWMWAAGRTSPSGLAVLILTALWPVGVWTTGWSPRRKSTRAGHRAQTRTEQARSK